MAEALYRKYRPQVFEDVVGQEPIQRTLKNAIAQDKVSHAYLFCGPRGTGKTTTARLLAKALLCESGPTPDPDGTCEDCRLIAEGAHPDVYELDAASRTGVENVREEIISRVHFAPTRGRNKVYIIDEVHMLSTAAFNALLKTLEEPPGHVVFILCTTDPQKVPETIHSRCQRFDFHRISPESMVARLGAICLAENVEFEGEALDLIAQRADGGLRNALTSLEQIIAFENGKVTLAGAERLLGSIDSNELAEILSYIGRRDIANCFRWTADYVETGADLANFVRDMAEHVRNLYVLALVGDDAELDVSETSRRELVGELAWFGPDRASRLLGVLGDLTAELKTTSNARLAFEIALTRMVRPDSDLTLEALAERVEALESGYSAVAHVLPGEPVAKAVAPEPASFEPAPPAPSTAFSEPDPARVRDAVPEAAHEPELAPAPATAPVPESGSARASSADSASAQAPAPAATSASAAATAPEPTAASSRSKAGQLSNPAALQRIWQAALASVKKQKAAYGVLFMGTKAVFDEAAGVLKVQFPSENTFAFGTAQKPDVQDALADALEKAVGEAVAFRIEQLGAAQATASSAEARTQPARQQAPRAEDRTEVVRQQASPSEGRQQPVREQALQSEGRTQGDMQEQAHASARSVSAAQPAEVAVYEQVPYEDMEYELVPYEEFEPGFTAPPPANVGGGAPAPASESTASAPEGARANGPSAAGAAGSSQSMPADRPEGGTASIDASNANLAEPDDDRAAVEALLQASFGAGVVISEAHDGD